MVKVSGYVGGVICMFGLGGCQCDCVFFCEIGCGNFIDVGGKVGGFISGFVGFCVVDGVFKIVNGVGVVVFVIIDGLLCIVGKVLIFFLFVFDCNCKQIERYCYVQVWICNFWFSFDDGWDGVMRLVL